MAEPPTKSAKRATDGMAHGALAAIRDLLDHGGIPRGTFADEQVQNLVALYNRRGDEIGRLHDGIKGIRNAIHACNRNPIPNSQRMRWRDMCDALLSPIAPALED